MLYDKDIREPLFDFLEETYGKIRILEEKRIARSRSDITMITKSEIIGIEIKSDADTYARLPSQIKDYDRFFDKNIIVVGTSHVNHISEKIPEYWGIISVEEDQQKADFYILRKPKNNPNLDETKKITILWRPELANIQEKNGLPKYKNYSKKRIQEILLKKVPGKILWEQVSEELFERDYTKIREQINEYRLANGQRRRKRNYNYKYKTK